MKASLSPSGEQAILRHPPCSSIVLTWPVSRSQRHTLSTLSALSTPIRLPQGVNARQNTWVGMSNIFLTFFVSIFTTSIRIFSSPCGLYTNAMWAPSGEKSQAHI
ncbi:hypothetical protein BJY01DRAFT_223973 [Aspergillus pseudoustus]|uniref:Uncharacterized protein n=1 Tax=Aspergillus pseudoustus TaxID=1810923 RepID=A0ABR4J3Z7_9EURO